MVRGGKANGTCIGKSWLKTPEASPPAAFDDATGRSPCCLGDSPAGSKVKLDLIRLYDKKSGKASIADYRWLDN